MPDTTETTSPLVTQELKVVTQAIEVSLKVREITIDFIQRRDQLITVASEFLTPPKNDDEQTDILTAQRGLQGLRKEVEKQATALKAPLNAARKNIIDIEERATAAIEKEEKRLQELVNNYQQSLADARRAEEQRLERERQEIERQRQQAQREQEEAERKRQQAEIARQQAEAANSPEAKQEAQQEQQRLQDEAAKLEADAYEKELSAAMAPTPAAIPSAPAPRAREIHTFSINGRNDGEKRESLIKLLHAKPEFFGAGIREEAPRGFTLHLKIKDLTDAINGVPPFQKLTGAPGITISTRLSTLR